MIYRDEIVMIHHVPLYGEVTRLKQEKRETDAATKLQKLQRGRTARREVSG